MIIAIPNKSSPAVGSHSVTYHTTQVNTPTLLQPDSQ